MQLTDGMQHFDAAAKEKDIDLTLAEMTDEPVSHVIDPEAEPEPESLEEAVVSPLSWGSAFWAGDACHPPASASSGGIRSWTWMISVGILVLASLRFSPDDTNFHTNGGSELGETYEDDWVTTPNEFSLDAPVAPASQNIEIVAPGVSANIHADADAEIDAEADSTLDDQAPAIEPAKLVSVDLLRQVVPLQTVNGVSVYKSSYYGTINAGTPSSSYKVVFDTGSGHLILPSRYCKSETCRAHKRYSPLQSTSAKNLDYSGKVVAPNAPQDQTVVNFGTGEVTGIFVKEVVCLESAATNDWTHEEMESFYNEQAQNGVEKPLPVGCMNLNFIAATEMSEDPFLTFEFDGVLGLGLSGLSQSPSFNFVKVLLQTSSEWGVNQDNIFAVFLAANGNAGSQITFGGWQQERLHGDVYWNDVFDPEIGHWIVRVKSIRVDGDEVNYCDDGACKAVADTGTALLGVPSDSFRMLYRLMWHPSPLDGQCKGVGPKVHIELDTFTLTLEPEDYAHPTPYSSATVAANAELPKPWGSPFSGGEEERFGPTRFDLQCRPMMMTTDHPEPIGPKLFILGEPVLRKYYTVYDIEQKRIGFGKSNHIGEVPDPKFAVDDDGSWFWEDDEEENE